VTPELKEYEEKILTAEEKIFRHRKDAFSGNPRPYRRTGKRIRQTARSYCRIRRSRRICCDGPAFWLFRPQISDSDEFIVRQGRHPVIEALAEEHRRTVCS